MTDERTRSEVRGERHRQAQRSHAQAAARHAEAAEFWDGQGDPVRAELERRNEAIERDAAELEGDRAALEESRGS
jgi:hypothetical protein